MNLSDFLPYAHDLDDAPQLAAVALLSASLILAERALLSAHPCLAGEDPADRQELLGAAIVSLAPVLHRALDEYRDAICPQSRDSASPLRPASKSRDEIPF